MASLEELKVIATEEIENAKPLFKVENNERTEFNEVDYEQAIEDLAQDKYRKQEYGYIDDRRDNYAPLQDQLDMQYWDSVNGTTTWVDHIAKVKSDFPKPS